MTKQNGHDDPKIVRFPSPEEQKTLEKAQFVHHNDEFGPRREPALNLPPVVQALCLANIILFLGQEFLPALLTEERLYALAFVPARYFGTEPLGLAALFSPFTHLFLHASWLHLGMNTGMLMAFGAGIEKALGGRRLLLLYLACGIAGSFTHAVFYPQMTVPMIGASGAISGLFGAVLLLMQETGAIASGWRRLLPLAAVWVGISVFFGLFGVPGVDNPIAWTAHVGGFVAGLLLYKPISRLRVQHWG